MTFGIDSSVQGSLGFVTLNRPEQHNAISKEMWRALPKVLTSLQHQGALAIILRGQDSDFSSGANTIEAGSLKTYEDARELWHAIRDALRAVHNFELPTIAMVQGTCFGGGCLLACACDLRFASDNAVFAIPIARLGLTLDDFTMSMVVSLIGPANTKRLIMTGENISAAQALTFGLINSVVPTHQLEEKTLETATRIANNDAFSLVSSKRSINRIVESLPLDPTVNDAEVTSAFISEAFQNRLSKRKT